jgi:hypothetical protein
MKLGSLFAALLAGLAMAGCADTSTASSDDHPSAIATAPHTDPDNPPPTLSGYVDSSYTEQTR